MEEIQKVVKMLENALKPYKGLDMKYSKLPKNGISEEKIIELMKELKKKEDMRWKNGLVSGAVYHGGQDHIDFLNKVYLLHSQTNPLHADIWPSLSKYESEIVSMTANMLNGDKVKDGQVCGTVSSGGTESIMLAMKTYRDYAEDKRGITKPEMVIPSSAHAAFDKASHYFKINAIRVPINDEFKADVKAMEDAVTENTIVMI